MALSQLGEMSFHTTNLNIDAKINQSITNFAPARSQTPTFGVYRDVFKRIFDTLLVLVSIPVVLPVVLLAAAVIVLDGHNPFYSQMRVGKNKRHFRMWKLRTMIPDADEKLAAYLEANPEAAIEWNATQKLKSDPRVTRFGRILRKTSLDELPQLLNVLTGSMSLVGPRPMMVQQQQYYFGNSYYNLRPGITGLWQISDRNECEFVGRVRYDDVYDRIISLKTDFGVLLRTVGVVMRGTGY